MSDGPDPRNNPFIRAIMGGPPTPEEKTAHQKHMTDKQKKQENMCKAALPIIKRIREDMRELISIGVSTHTLTKGRKAMAVLEDDVSAMLVLPPHECD